MHKKTLKNIHLRFDNYIGNIFYSIFIFTFLFKNYTVIPKVKNIEKETANQG